MADYALQIDSPFIYIRHDNAGQTVPINNPQLQVTITADGLSINIGDNTVIADPIVIINTAATSNTAKNSVHLGRNSQVQIVEYLISDDPNSNNNVSTTINCSAGSQLQHCILEYANAYADISQQASTEILQASASHVTSSLFSFGGGRSHLALRIALQGKHAHCDASSLAYTIGSEIQETVLKIEHESPQCTSNTVTRNVLKDSSQTDLAGKIIVHPGASKTIAELQIKNLLCSAKTQAINKPELEIFNDDVRCTHGSSSGQLDDAALFYIRSRGLDLAAAREILIQGFIYPAIARCRIAAVVDYVNNIIKGR